jgi:RNA ligase
MANERLLTRDEFRDAVFTRDGHCCVFCRRPAVDAHHIIERRLWPDGGYYLDNGVSVCGDHHIRCETTEISIDEVRRAGGITRVIVPPHLDADQIYDKWGNPVLPNGRRLKGELFNDESVQRILARGGMLRLFTDWVKYPRTYHLPWSEGIQDDDRTLESLDAFAGRRVVVTEKMDGENTSLYRDHLHARSLDGRHHPSRNWVKQFWSRLRADIPEGWRICGENLYARHSIH